jgi:acetyl-CoA synthetase
LLAHYGIAVPPSRVIASQDRAAAEQACSHLGYPLVLKILAAEIAHKTDVGGVQLELSSFAEVEAAMAAMAPLGTRFLLERMLPKPVAEMILGLSFDPQFGLSLTLGAGGILVELLHDYQVLLLPTTPAEIAQALTSLTMYPLLQGYRGVESVDLETLIETILKLARFAEDKAAQLLELDVNPLFIYPDRVIAVDALIHMQS